MCFYDQRYKITWGLPYGCMNANGGGVTGQKSQWLQYSLSILFDSKAHNGVYRVRNENRAIQNGTATVTAGYGTMRVQGPVGTRNPALQNLVPAGFDHNFRAWWVNTIDGSALLGVSVTDDTMSLLNPTFRLSNMDALPAAVKLNSQDLALNTGYYASYDAVNREAWVTIVHTFVKGTTPVQFGAGVGVNRPCQPVAADLGPANSLVSIYRLDGSLVARKEAAVSGTHASHLAVGAGVPHGSYVMRVSGNGRNTGEVIVSTRR
jgi:hypothetical protein